MDRTSVKFNEQSVEKGEGPERSEEEVLKEERTSPLKFREIGLIVAYLNKQIEDALNEGDKEKAEALRAKRKTFLDRALTEEAQYELAKAPRFAVEGLSSQIKGALENEEVKKEIQNLIEAEEEENEEGIKKARDQLLEIAEKQNLPLLDDDEFRLIASRVIPPAFHDFFEKHCKFQYVPSADPSVEIENEKIVFTFGDSTLYDKVDNIKIKNQPIRVLKPLRVAEQIGNFLGRLLRPPEGWEKISQKQDVPEKWEDFVGLYCTNRQKAEEVAPEAVEYLNQLFVEASQGRICLREEYEKFATAKEFEPKEIPRVSFLGSLRKFARVAFFPLLSLWHIRNVIYKGVRKVYEEKLIWFDLAMAQRELEEAKLITTRQEHASVRLSRLQVYILTGDKWGARGLLLSLANTSDSHWKYYHLYLAAFDPVYRATKGEQISRESYDFLVRCTRQSAIAGHRYCSKVGEYNRKVLPDGRVVYTRSSQEEWDEAAITDAKELSVRQVLNAAGEAYSHWKAADGRIMEIDELMGVDEPPLAYREGWDGLSESEWPKRKEIFEYGDWADPTLGIPERYRNLAFREIRPTYKIDPDQFALVARLVALTLIRKEGGEVISRYVRDPLAGAEHARAIQKELVGFCLKRLEQYEDWKRRTGQTIEGYERFIKMVNALIQSELTGVAEEIIKNGNEMDRRVLEKYGTPEAIQEAKEARREEASKITAEEPNIRLHRAPEKTVTTYKKVKEAADYLRQDYEESLEKLDIPEELKKWLARKPERILDLLSHPTVTSLEIALEILKVEPDQIAERSNEIKQLAEEIERSADRVLKRYFRENQERLKELIQVCDWVSNNDLVPFLESVERASTSLEIESDQSKVQNLLKKFEDKIKTVKILHGPLMGTEQLQAVGLSDEEVNEIKEGLKQLGLLPKILMPDATDIEKQEARKRISFCADLEEDDPLRLYFILKAHEAALFMKSGAELSTKKESEKPSPTPFEEEGEDVDEN